MNFSCIQLKWTIHVSSAAFTLRISSDFFIIIFLIWPAEGMEIEGVDPEEKANVENQRNKEYKGEDN